MFLLIFYWQLFLHRVIKICTRNSFLIWLSILLLLHFVLIFWQTYFLNLYFLFRYRRLLFLNLFNFINFLSFQWMPILLFLLLFLFFEINWLYWGFNFLNGFLNNSHLLVQFFIIIIPFISKWFYNNLQLIYSFFSVFLDLFCSFFGVFLDLSCSLFGKYQVHTLILLSVNILFLLSFCWPKTPLFEITRYGFVLWSLVSVVEDV